MKPIITGVACIMLLANVLCIAQNDTPMEILIHEVNANERFIQKDIFVQDERPSEYLNDYLSDYSLLELNLDVLNEVLTNKYEFLNIHVPSPRGAKFNIKLVSFDVRSEGFKVFEQSNRVKTEVNFPDAVFYRGIIERGSHTQTGISIFENELFGLASTLEEGNIIIAKDPINPGKQGQNYIVYFEKDLLFDRNSKCLTDELRQLDPDDYSLNSTRTNVYETCEDVEIEIEATRKLYLKKGSTSSTVNYISAFFNNVAIIYRNEGIYTSLKSIVVNTTEDGYTNLTTSLDKLNKFGDNTRNTYQNSGAELAHLVDYNTPGLGGVAWINVLCTNYIYYSAQQYHYGAYAYSSIEDTHQEFPDYSLTVFMFSHEMGHNLGSRHTQSCSWDGGPIDNCAPVENGPCSPGPSPVGGGTIMSYCHSTSYGINYSKGFGVQPGNKIRSLIQSKTCVENYIPTGILGTIPSQTITANRECTDDAGWTNYYFDNNSTSESDDKLLLMVKKEGEDIGNLDDGTLTVKVKTSSKAGKGSTHISNPGYSASPDWHVMNRWFELVPTTEPNSPVTVRFPYSNEDFNDVMMNQPAIHTHKDLTFYKISNPGNPNPDGGHVNVTNNQIVFYENGDVSSLTEWKYINISGRHFAEFQVNSFSGGGGGFSENGMLQLPVELHDFTVTKRNDKAEIKWSTSSEINNDYFTIERSSDGKEFESIGKIAGNGTSFDLNDYTFVDRQPLEGRNYYRLKQLDFNGVYEYLGIRTVEFETFGKINIFPNPLINELLTLEYESKNSGRIEVRINDISGNLVHFQNNEIDKGSNNLSIDLSILNPGIYIVQITGMGTPSFQKLVKQ